MRRTRGSHELSWLELGQRGGGKRKRRKEKEKEKEKERREKREERENRGERKKFFDLVSGLNPVFIVFWFFRKIFVRRNLRIYP